MRILALLFLLLPWQLASAQADRILGDWYTENHKAKVTISKVNNKYYGKIVWLKEPNDAETKKPKVDKHNPDPKLKTRPIIGLNLIRDFEYVDGIWDNGLIYDPENGKEYSCYIKFENEKKLYVRGYIGFSLIGRTTYWTKD